MVKVECHGCSAPYQIDERRIPPAGLKMRCPKCGTGLLVQRPGEDGQQPPPPPPAPPPAAPPAYAAPQMPAALAPSGEWSGVELPSPAAPGGARGGGGFGEIDLDIQDGGPAGEVDLPVVPGRPAPAAYAPPGYAPPAAPVAAPMFESSGVDLPAVAPQGGGGFGSLDFGFDGAPSGAIDLPATRGAPAPPPPPAHVRAPTGEIDLPAVRPQAPAYAPIGRPPTPPHSQPGLPAVFGGQPSAPQTAAQPFSAQPHAGLPMPFAPSASAPPITSGPGGTIGLPTPAPGGFGAPSGFGGGAGLPSPATGNASVGLPMPGGANVGLPAPGAGLPMTSQSGLPMTSQGGLPMTSQGGLPMTSAGGLPMTSQGGLPSASAGGLPSASAGGLPSASAGGLPMPNQGGLPMHSAGGFPVAGGAGAGLPTPGGPGLPSGAGGAGLPQNPAGGLPSPGGPGFPAMSHAGLPVVGAAGLPSPGGPGLPSPFVGTEAPGFGGEAPFTNEPGPRSGEFVGGEIDLDGKPGLGPEAAPIARKQRRLESEEAPQKRSNTGLKIAGVGIVLVALVGGAGTFVESIGPFGWNFVSDKLNKGKNEAALQTLRKDAQERLDEDTLTSATAAVDKGKKAQAARERHNDTTAYTAFLHYMKSIRFGQVAANDQAAKALLDKTDRKATSASELLALSAEDVLAGQLARAKQSVDKVLAKDKGDIDAAVLAGEIDLRAKEFDKAVTEFEAAVNSRKSARTLYGLARAQVAASKSAEAAATAKAILELSKNHVGARIILARIAMSQGHETEALDLLTQVTKDAAVKGGASQAELMDSYVLIGNVQLAASRISLAQEAFDEALKIDPQSVDALVGRGELFYRSGRFTGAEAAFDSALKSNGDNAHAKIGMAKTWFALEKFKEAKDYLAKLQTALPQDPRVDYWLARVSEALGQRKDAEAFYNAAIEKAKTSEDAVPAYVGVASLLAKIGRPDDAAKKLSEAATKFPDSPELARARGDVALQSGNLSEAISQYEEALKKAPNDLATRFALAVALRRMRRFPEALATLDKVQAIDPEYPGLALERGLYFEETGKPDEALRMYQQALQKAPNDVDLKLRIGSTQVIAGAAKQAEPLLKEVLRDRQNSAEANHFLGRAMLLTSSNLNEAIRLLKRAVEIDGNRAEYHLYLGWAAITTAQYGLAKDELAKAIELDPTLGDAYWQRGVLLSRQGACNDAIKDLETALEKRKSRFEAYATLGYCYGQLNNNTKAEEAYRKAIAGNPDVAEWHNAVGIILANRSDSKAIEEFEKALDLSQNVEPKPGWFAKAHYWLGKLYESTAKDKAAAHCKEYLRLALPGDAYRSECEPIANAGAK